MPDKRRWATPEQQTFLDSWVPQYRDAQAQRRYDKFWPSFFQEWFTSFPVDEPTDDDPSESEPGSDGGTDAESAVGDSSGSMSKRKNAKSKKRKKVKYIFAMQSLILFVLQPSPPVALTPEARVLKQKGVKIRAIKKV
jgi:hypothetical protein